MKRLFQTILRLLTRSLLWLFVAVYVLIAVCNYSVVQSIAGSIASSKLSEKCGGEVRVGSLGVNIFNSVVVRNVLLITPTNDTVVNASKIVCRFKQFPFDGTGLSFDRVTVQNTYYHLGIDSTGLNLKYILSQFAKKDTTPSEGGRFLVQVDRLRLRNVHYRMSLEKSGPAKAQPEHGVDIPRMEFSKINAVMRNVRVDADHITCRIERFEAHERSGFNLADMKMNVYVANNGISVTDMEIHTDSTLLKGDVLLDYTSWKTMSHFLDSVYIFARFDSSTVGCLADAAYWAPVLWGMDERINLQGVVYGTIANLHATDMQVSFGSDSKLFFDGDIVGLPHIDSTKFRAEVYNLHTNHEDLYSVHFPPNVRTHAKGIVQKLGDIDIQATFEGYIKDFYSTADVQTDLGNLSADLFLRYDKSASEYVYTAEAHSPMFRLSGIVNNEWVSRSGFEVSAQGRGFNPKTMNNSLEGHLYNTVFRGNDIDNLTFTAEAFNGNIESEVHVEDSLISLWIDLRANIGDSIPVINAGMGVSKIDLTALHIVPQQKLSGKTSVNDTLSSMVHHSILSTQLQLQCFGTDLNNLYGSAVVDNTKLTTANGLFYIRSASLGINTDNHYKNITFGSDLCALSLKGYFDYSDFGAITTRFIQSYIPTYFVRKNVGTTKLSVNGEQAMTEFDFSLVWHDTTNRIAMLVPGMHVASGTMVNGSYNYAEALKLVARSDSLSFGSIKLTDLALTGNSMASSYSLNLSSDCMLGSTSLLNDVKLAVNLANRESLMKLVWNNDDELDSRGDIELCLLSDSLNNELQFRKNTFSIRNEQWTISSDTPIRFTDRSLLVDALIITDGNQRLQADVALIKDSLFHNHHSTAHGSSGVEPAHKSSNIALNLKQFNLEKFSFLTEKSGIELKGVVNGEGDVDLASAVPYVSANLSIKELVVNEQPLGDVKVQSTYDSDSNDLSVYLTTVRTGENGTYAPVVARAVLGFGERSNGPTIAADVAVNELSLKMLSPMLSSVSSKVDGLLSGNIDVTGSLDNLAMNGSLFVKKGMMNVDYLNIPLYFSDSIHVYPDKIKLHNFAVYDNAGNLALLNGELRHSNLKDFTIDASLTTRNFTFMSTTAGSQPFYGTVLAAAEATVKGPFNDLSIVVDAQTNSGSNFVVPINNQKTVSSIDYIQFVQPTYNSYSNQVDNKKGNASRNRFKLAINLAVTPDLRVGLPLDFSQMYADVNATGRGDLQVNISSESGLSLLGSYELSDGAMSVSVLNVLSKKFNIDDGSTITFRGNPSNAMLDIRAVYSQRVNLSSLTGALATDNSQTSVQVENVIALSGELQNPAISFDMRLPNADQSLQDEVFSYIDRTNEKDMMNQTLSLLLRKRFYSASSSESASGDLLENGLSTGYGAVVGTVGSWVSSMVDFADVNFDYKSATELTTEQYELDINKEWNKLYLETTFGYGGDSRNLSEISNSNSLTGDMLLGYKISPSFHLFVFNRSNTNNYTRSDLPYKQGLGLKYTKEFDHISDLFKRSK